MAKKTVHGIGFLIRYLNRYYNLCSIWIYSRVFLGRTLRRVHESLGTMNDQTRSTLKSLGTLRVRWAGSVSSVILQTKSVRHPNHIQSYHIECVFLSGYDVLWYDGMCYMFFPIACSIEHEHLCRLPKECIILQSSEHWTNSYIRDFSSISADDFPHSSGNFTTLESLNHCDLVWTRSTFMFSSFSSLYVYFC